MVLKSPVSKSEIFETVIEITLPLFWIMHLLFNSEWWKNQSCPLWKQLPSHVKSNRLGNETYRFNHFEPEKKHSDQVAHLNDLHDRLTTIRQVG